MNQFISLQKFYCIASLWACLFISGHAHAAQQEQAYMKAYRYSNGLLTGTISPDPDAGGSLHFLATRNNYNAGLLMSIESGELAHFPSEDTPVGAWSGFTVYSKKEITYDSYGRKATVTSYDKNQSVLSVTEYGYDSRSRTLCTALRMNLAVTGNACTSSNSSGLNPDRITRFTYDEFDQVTTEERAVGTAIQQNYVSNVYVGRFLRYQVDANCNKTEFRYDNLWRLSKIVYPMATTSLSGSQTCNKPYSANSLPANAGGVNESDYVEYAYDANDNKTFERKRNGAVINYTLDNLNRVIVKDYVNNTKQQDIYYDYDNRGLLLSSRFNSVSGKGIVTSFDGFGNVDAHYNFMSSSPRILHYKYDANNNRTSLIHHDGATFSYAFDRLNRVTRVSDPFNGHLLSVNYHANGRRANLTRANPQSTVYSFQNGVQLDSFRQNFSGTGLTNSFLYNSANQITQRTYSNSTFYYTGNENRTGNYAVNGLNQYTYVGGPTPGTGQPFSYDPNGNLTNDGTQVYTYDDENRLLSTVSPTATSNFVYDPNGRLFQVTINGNTRQFLYDGDALVAEYDTAGTMLRRYVHGDQVDEPWVQYNSSVTYAYQSLYLYADHQGSIIAQGSHTGGVWKSLAYDNFGIAASKNVDTFGYTGQVYFKELGLNYYKARIYNPKLGRFLQTDPIGYKDNMNLYAYVGNDPVNKTDPTGMIAETPWDIANVVIGVGSMAGNIAVGNYGKAAVDAVGIVVDVGATVLPGVPGGAGTAINATRAANMARGRASEARKLAEIGATKNHTKASTSTGDRIRDGTKADGTHIEVKDTARVDNTAQIRGLDEAAGKAGVRLEIHTGTSSNISRNVNERALPNTDIIKCPTLGPQCK